MNETQIKELVAQLTVRVEAIGTTEEGKLVKEKGTGVLLLQDNKAYILTVHHCIYGEKEPFHIVKRENIKFSFLSDICSESINPIKITPIKKNLVLMEIDINKLKKTNMKCHYLDKAYDEVQYYLRGFPKSKVHNFKAECNEKDVDEVTFKIDVDRLTDDIGGENAKTYIRGLSGSGVFFGEYNHLYLVGLTNRLRDKHGRFNTIHCTKLVDLKNTPIKLSQYQEKPSLKLTKEILKEQREKSPFKPIKKNTNQVYIDRDIDETILDTINNKHSSVLFINGQGGVGKSTLLEKFSKTDNPTIFIHLKDRVDMSILDIFLDEATIYNCPKFQDKLDDIFILKENDEKIPITSELELFEALQEDFKEYGVFIVDTFEKIKNSNIQSNVSFKNNNTPITTQSISYRFRDYLEYLVYIFLFRTTFIIAGRNRISDVKGDKSEDKYLNLKEVRELSLDNFSLPQVEEYIKGYNLEKPSDNQLSIMDELTHGNPLLIYLFIKIVNDEYEGNWDELDYFEMKEIVQEDSKYGLIYYFTKRILSHIDIKDIWKLVIPRVLIKEMEKILFKNNKTFDLLVDVGLAQNGKGKQRNIYTLHDNVYDAIFSYAKSELGNYKLSSWYDNKKVRKLNKIMIDFFKHCNNLKNINCQFEECYHKIMRIKDFEKTYKSSDIISHNKLDRDNSVKSNPLLFDEDNKIITKHNDSEFLSNGLLLSEKNEINLNHIEINRDDFAKSFLGSLLFSKEYKINFCKKFKQLKNKELKKYIDIAINEQSLFQISSNLYNEISRAISFGQIENMYDLKFLEKLSQNKLKDDWSVYFLIGFTYSQNKQYKNAIESYSESLKLKPKNYDMYSNLGIMYYEIDNYIKAIESYQNAIKINENRYESYFNMGLVFAKQNNYNEAIKLYKKALFIDNNIDEIYFSLGYAYDEIEEYKNAVESYKKAIEINPNRDNIYYNLGITYIKQKDYDSAIKVFKKVVKLNPSHDEAYYHLGIIYLNFKEEYANALENYLKVIKLNSNKYKHLYYVIGELYFREENYDKAIEYCEKSIERNLEIDNSYLIIEHSYYAIGILYYRKKEYDNAIEAYQKAIDINPKYDTYYNMGVAYRDRNKKEYLKEIELYQKAIDINPNYEYAYHNMGVAYFYLREIDNAIKAYQKAIDINPEYDDAYYHMGLAYRDRNKKEYLKEIELYQKAIDINPSYEYAYNNMGVAYFHLREIDKTIEIYEKVLQINPLNIQVRGKLFDLIINYEYYKSLG